ncbi:MAG: hypothetical protein IPM69_10610 [Ignavibacteria bacterium]|nr:hypothetical protein [Ignavibacteria bacterium]
MIRFGNFLLFALLLGTSPYNHYAQHSPKPTIPSSFIQNQGQSSPEVLFMAQARLMNVSLTQKGIMYDVYQSMPRVSHRSDALGGQSDTLFGRSST